MTLDLSSLFHTTIGFDDIARILNNFANSEQDNTYPPYNISKHDDNNYVIEMALAGFNKDNIEIELSNGELTVKSKNKDSSEKNVNLIHQGISLRSFVRKFTLSDEIIVKNAEMKDGMLSIKLERFIPENKKPKLISIK